MAAARKKPVNRWSEAWAYYRDATPLPLYSLLFLFPIVVAYEAGALMLRPSPWPNRDLVAQSVIQSLFGWFGAEVPWLSGAALVLVLTLLVWHVLSGRTWRVRLWVPLLMLVESVVLTVPLFVINRLGSAAVLQQAFGGGEFETLRELLVLGLGAALYEELVFRLALLGLLMLLLAHTLNLPRTIAIPVAIALGAVIFALCHVQPVGAEGWDTHRFLIRAAAGGYLSLVFMMRGLGVATGAHAAYDVILLFALYR